MASPTGPRRQALAVATLASPFLIFACDRGLLFLIAPLGQPWTDLVFARPASFLVCGLLFLVLVGSISTVRLELGRSLTLAMTIGGAFAAAAFLAVMAGARAPELPGTAIWGFLVFGLMAEEWLFRGVVFRAFEDGRWGLAGAIIASAMLFAVSHFGYHSFRATPDAWRQVLYTLPLGLALGWLRARTGRILPGAIVHLMFNGAGLLAARLAFI